MVPGASFSLRVVFVCMPSRDPIAYETSFCFYAMLISIRTSQGREFAFSKKVEGEEQFGQGRGGQGRAGSVSTLNILSLEKLLGGSVATCCRFKPSLYIKFSTHGLRWPRALDQGLMVMGQRLMVTEEGKSASWFFHFFSRLSLFHKPAQHTHTHENTYALN